MDESTHCYIHGFKGIGPCPYKHAYEGDREYFTAQIAKLQGELKAYNRILELLVDVVDDLQANIAKSSPPLGTPSHVGARKQGRLSHKTCDHSWGYCTHGTKQTATKGGK